MHTAEEIYNMLCEPFTSDEIEWRVGATNADKTQGMALAYLNARAVMERLDSVCGSNGWQNKNTFGPNGAVFCDLGIRMDGEWIWKADGAGATDVEGEKGAMSDALKRAAVRFGVGRYLYELESPWVKIENKRIAKDEWKRLAEIHDQHCLKAGWGNRSGIQAYKLMNSAIKQWVTSPDDAIRFNEDNKSMIAQLPVAMRKHLQSTLDKIGAPQREAAE